MKLNHLVIGVAVLFLAPAASANHGQGAAYVGSLANGSTIVVVGTYGSGDGDFQTWLMDVVVDGEHSACTGFGSIEAGFSFIDCPGAVGGTGRFQPYLSVPPVDSGDVTVTWLGSSGSATFVEVG